jgi:uncharacterized protein
MKEAKQGFTISWQLVATILVITNVLMLVLWAPWTNSSSKDKAKIHSSGEGIVETAPDEFMFSVTFERPTQAEINALSTTIVDQIKKDGVAEADIKTSASVYDKIDEKSAPSITYPVRTIESNSLSVTVTARSKQVAEKVQNRLIENKAKGTLSPYGQFSVQKRKELRDQAREKAIEDAKSKAEKTAKSLGSKVGKVLEINESTGSGFPYPYPMADSAKMSAPSGGSEGNLPIQTGDSQLSYSVVVVFELR